MAARLTAKVARRYGARGVAGCARLAFVFPVRKLALADPLALKLWDVAGWRAEALIHLAQATLVGKLIYRRAADIEQKALKNLQTFRELAAGLLNYFALRGWQAKDIFLPDDYFLLGSASPG